MKKTQNSLGFTPSPERALSKQERKAFDARLVRGFTLIEVLIVISIIGVLSSLTLLGTSSFRASGRDAKRMTDLRQVTNALELYYAKNGVYPDAISDLVKAADNSAGVIDALPTDPSSDANYGYDVCDSGYIVKATLEQTKVKDGYIGTCGDISCAADKPQEFCIKY